MARILIVEDEDRISSLLQIGLNRKGFETEVTDNGNAGLAKLLADEYDLCLLDLRLPGKDGLDVLAEARAEGIKLPIVILSAWCDPKLRAMSLARGANNVIDKPFKFTDLLECIHSELQGI